MNIYVGNLSYEVTEEDLKQAFGQVETVKIIKDRWSGQPRGFGFVEMSDRAEAHSAINGLGGTIMGGRTLKVSEARQSSGARRGGGRRGGGRRQY
jgi:RNA recognition motif-containing protein